MCLGLSGEKVIFVKLRIHHLQLHESMTAQSEQALENGLIAPLQDMSYEYVH
jgi:hypothetical protein